jgi:hypothetical protein
MNVAKRRLLEFVQNLLHLDEFGTTRGEEADVVMWQCTAFFPLSRSSHLFLLRLRILWPISSLLNNPPAPIDTVSESILPVRVHFLFSKVVVLD